LLGALDVEGTKVPIIGCEDLSGKRKATAVQFMAPGLGPSVDSPASQVQFSGRVWNFAGARYALLHSEEELDALLAERQDKAVAFMFASSAWPTTFTETQIQSMKDQGIDPNKVVALIDILNDRIPKVRSLMLGVWRPTDKDKLPLSVISPFAQLNAIQSGNGPLPIEIRNPQDLDNLKNNLGLLPVTNQIIYWK
jgi:hypothetical protein